VYSSIYLSTQGYKNKKESREISTIYGGRLGHLPPFVKVNTPLSLVLNSGNSDLTATRLAPVVRNFSTKLSVNNSEISEEFLSWFSGFTDGEGNFSIMLDRTYIRFRFKISLHIDDLEVLNVIKSNLNIGKIIIEEKRNSCAFVVQSFSELKDVFSLATALSLLFNNLITGVRPSSFGFKLLFIIYYYGGLLKRSGNNYSLLVVKRLRNSGLLYLNRSVSDIRRPNNIVRFYSSGAIMQPIVQPTEQDLIKLEPWFVTGFTDGEGNFGFSITLNNNRRLNVKFFFLINLHLKDMNLLKSIQNFFGVGYVYLKKAENLATYMVQSKDDLDVLIKHFNSYPLISNKFADYLLFKQAFELFKNKEHLTPEGLIKILSIKASINRGLPEKLQVTFPNVVPVDRPRVLDQVIKDPYWIAGFSSAEGSFYISFMKSKTLLAGRQVLLTFSLTQHSRDADLMKNIISYLECGRYSLRKNKLAGDIEVTKFSDLYKKIIPFFSKYPIKGEKSRDFFDFCSAAELMKNKVHLTEEGLETIQKIKEGMNKSRSFSILDTE
jgi:hypothetical protein